jgi:hypothetical protein
MSDSDMVQRHFDITTHIHGCFECPDAVLRAGVEVCLQALGQAGVREQNAHAITPSCPQWPWSKA